MEIELAPISDGATTEWGAFGGPPHYICVDEDPQAPVKADYLNNTGDDELEQLGYAATETDITEATAIKVTMAWSGGSSRGDPDAVEFKLYGNGVLKSTKIINTDTSDVDQIGWFMMPLAAPLTQLEADNLRLDKTTMNGSGAGEDTPNIEA